MFKFAIVGHIVNVYIISGYHFTFALLLKDALLDYSTIVQTRSDILQSHAEIVRISLDSKLMGALVLATL